MKKTEALKIKGRVVYTKGYFVYKTTKDHQTLLKILT